MIPSIYQSDEPVEDLKSYCGNYLQEEIQAEGLVRKIENFSRFLETASLVNGELVNMESLSSDTGIPSNSLREYFSILEDTLIGSMLKPFKRAVHRKAISKAKFYLLILVYVMFLRKGETFSLNRHSSVIPLNILSITN